MSDYKMLKPDSSITRDELIKMYNDAVETIWELTHNYTVLDEAYDNLFYDYEKAMDELYG